MVIIVMGVSGSGKSTIGRLLGQKLNLPFYDADDYHPLANIEKMASGLPLDDSDRQPWLEKLGRQIKIWESTGGAVLACSALKKKYREQLCSIPKNRLRFVFLSGSFDLIKARLNSRKNHFFDEKLLQSQFDILEVPTDAFEASIANSPDRIVDRIIEYLK